MDLDRRIFLHQEPVSADRENMPTKKKKHIYYCRDKAGKPEHDYILMQCSHSRRPINAGGGVWWPRAQGPFMSSVSKSL